MYKTISDAENTIVMFRGINSKWMYATAVANEEEANHYIARELRKDAARSLNTELTRLMNGDVSNLNNIAALCAELRCAITRENDALALCEQRQEAA